MTPRPCPRRFSFNGGAPRFRESRIDRIRQVRFGCRRLRPSAPIEGLHERCLKLLVEFPRPLDIGLIFRDRNIGLPERRKIAKGLAVLAEEEMLDLVRLEIRKSHVLEHVTASAQGAVEHLPHDLVVARAGDRVHTYELYRAGATM